MPKYRVNSQTYWNNRFEHDWERMGGRAQTRYFADMALRHLPRWLTNDLQQNRLSLCDWGCAEGDATQALAERFPGCEVTGVDFAERAIANARAHYPERRFACSAEAGLQGAYDVIYSSNTLEHFENPLQVMRELMLRARRYLVLLLPFREADRNEEHFYTFDYNSFRLRIGAFHLVHVQAIECSGNDFWKGQQVLVIYANQKEVDLEAINCFAPAQPPRAAADCSVAVDPVHEAGEPEAARLEAARLRAEVERLGKQIEALEAEVRQRAQAAQDLEIDLARLQDESSRLRETLRANEGIIDRLKREAAEQAGELQQARQEAADRAQERLALQAELASVQSSMSYRLATRYNALRNTSPVLGRAHRLLKKVAAGPAQAPHAALPVAVAAPAIDVASQVRDFLISRAGKPTVLVYSGVRYVESEGQRSVRLAQSLAKNGNNVIYSYWNWGEADHEPCHEASPGLFVVAKTDLLRNARQILEAAAALPSRRLALFELPDPEAVPLVTEALGQGFHAVYDLLDDWEEFHKLGQAPWFQKDAEQFFLRNCTRSCAVTKALADKFKGQEVGVIPNGFDPEKLTERPTQDQPRGKELTIGYFGYLTEAWFDWPMLLETAQANPGFMFHLLGYGMPTTLSLPPNVRYLGKVHPNELSGYVKNWDVCIIPFKEGELARSADPIKLYEYLYFQKPVVVTGLPHLSEFPYVTPCANKASAFKKALVKAKGTRLDLQALGAFLADRTWQRRAVQVLEMGWEK